MIRSLTVIGAATSAGAYGPGQEQASRVLREHGLVTRLAAGGREVRDLGDVVTETFRADPDHPEAGNVTAVVAAAQAVAGAVGAELDAGHDVLVVGGDCTVEVGTVAGAVVGAERVGLVYVDLDGDLNTPATGDGILDWMGLAHLLGVEGCDPRLVEAGPRVPLLAPDAVRLVGVDNLTAAESATAADLGLDVATYDDVVERYDDVLAGLRRWAASYDRVLVHVDVDVLDYREFPIAHEVREVRGLSIDRLATLTRDLCALPGWCALTVCEVNPDHVRSPDQLDRMVALVADAVTGG